LVDKGDDTATSHEQPFVLMSGIDDLSLTYRGYADDRHDTGWISNWAFPQSLPLLIRLHVTRSTGQDTEWVFRLSEPIH